MENSYNVLVIDSFQYFENVASRYERSLTGNLMFHLDIRCPVLGHKYIQIDFQTEYNPAYSVQEAICGSIELFFNGKYKVVDKKLYNVTHECRTDLRKIDCVSYLQLPEEYQTLFKDLLNVDTWTLEKLGLESINI